MVSLTMGSNCEKSIVLPPYPERFYECLYLPCCAKHPDCGHWYQQTVKFDETCSLFMGNIPESPFRLVYHSFPEKKKYRLFKEKIQFVAIHMEDWNNYWSRYLDIPLPLKDEWVFDEYVEFQDAFDVLKHWLHYLIDNPTFALEYMRENCDLTQEKMASIQASFEHDLHFVDKIFDEMEIVFENECKRGHCNAVKYHPIKATHREVFYKRKDDTSDYYYDTEEESEPFYFNDPPEYTD